MRCRCTKFSCCFAGLQTLADRGALELANSLEGTGRLGLGFQQATIWIADAHRNDGKRFAVHAEEKLTAFMELESVIRACGELS
jgi:hypothetical protein